MEIDKEDSLPAKQSGTLTRKVVRGTLWIATSYTFSNILYFLRTVILVRFLNPLDFGLMGIATVVVNMLNLFSETGISMAIVQKKEVSKSTLNTSWIMTAIRGFCLFVLLYTVSPLISHYYNNEHLVPILRLISLSFLFTGLTSAGVFLFIKELDFKNKVIFEQANAISNTIVSVALAIIFRNVLALVIGYIVGSIFGLIFSYRLHPFRPRLRFDWNELRSLFSFGKYIYGSGIMVFLFIQGPNAIVGKMLGLDSLGLYVVAFGIANTPTTSVTHLVSQIAFPVYAKLQDDLPTLRDGYFKVTRLVAFLSTPLAGGIFMLIPEFIQIFLGVKWMPIVLPVRILCILGFCRSIYSTVSPVFLGIGRPDLELKFNTFNFSLLAILFYPLTVNRGIIGTSIAFSLVGTISIFCIMVVIYRLIKIGIEKAQFFKILFFPILATLLMCFSVYLIKLTLTQNLIITFSISIFMGAVSYISVLYIFDKYFGYGLIDTIIFAANSFKKPR